MLFFTDNSKNETIGKRMKIRIKGASGRYKHLIQVDDFPHLSVNQEQEELASSFAESTKRGRYFDYSKGSTN
jgi:hypothetical protein